MKTETLPLPAGDLCRPTLLGRLVSTLPPFIQNALPVAWRFTLLGPAATPNINRMVLRLCGDNLEHAKWMLRWLAYPLRNKGAKMHTALWLRGGQGSGKNLFLEQIIAPAYGSRAQVIEAEWNENAWMCTARLAIINGFVPDDANMERAKHLLTSPKIRIRQPYGRAIWMINKTNLVFIGSDTETLPLEANPRRFAIINATPWLPLEVWDGVMRELAEGGAELFAQFLIEHLDMSDFDAKMPPPSPRN